MIIDAGVQEEMNTTSWSWNAMAISPVAVNYGFMSHEN